MPCAFAISRIFASGPTRMGTMSPFSAASIAPASAVSSHGCATAVVTAGRLRHRSSMASYFPVPVFSMATSGDGAGPAGGRPCLFQEEREHHGERDAGEQRGKSALVVFELHRGGAAAD